MAQSLPTHCPLDNGRLQPRTGSAKTSIGHLEVLPMEILQLALSSLDLQSLTV
jgi:hypothetical protein